MGQSATKIDYSQLVQEYYDNLNDNLRHFRGGPGFLETWVHDEHHGRSILGILELAHTAKVGQLEIQLPEGLALPWEWLQKESAGLGSLEWSGSSLRFTPNAPKQAEEELNRLHPAYRAALRDRKVLHAGAPSSFEARDWLLAEIEGQRIGLKAVHGIVVEAFHEGKGVHAPLLDCFVEALLGRSLAEGAEHAVIRLERQLRDPREAPPVPGLVTPENSDPLFRDLQALIRTLAAPAEASSWVDPVPPAWMALSLEEKMAAALSAIHGALARLSLADPGLELLGVKNEKRFVISYPAGEAHRHWHHHLIELERALRRELGFEAELQLSDLSDRNRRVERTQRAES